MTFDDFLEIQARVQPEQHEKTDAYRLLCEVRQLYDVLGAVAQLTNLGDWQWGPDRGKTAIERMGKIRRVALDRKFEADV